MMVYFISSKLQFIQATSIKNALSKKKDYYMLTNVVLISFITNLPASTQQHLHTVNLSNFFITYRSSKLRRNLLINDKMKHTYKDRFTFVISKYVA